MLAAFYLKKYFRTVKVTQLLQGSDMSPVRPTRSSMRKLRGRN